MAQDDAVDQAAWRVLQDAEREAYRDYAKAWQTGGFDPGDEFRDAFDSWYTCEPETDEPPLWEDEAALLKKINKECAQFARKAAGFPARYAEWRRATAAAFRTYKARTDAAWKTYHAAIGEE